MKNLRTYKALTTYGFSGFKALEIVVDARQGDKYARPARNENECFEEKEKFNG